MEVRHVGINYGNIVAGLLQGGATTMDQTHSGNGSNLRSLRRMEIVYKDIDIPFAVNPSDYTQKEPNRVNITQTKGGAWIDAWGPGIVEISIKGITGVAGRKSTASDVGSKGSKTLEKWANTLEDAFMMFSGDNGVDVGYQRWRELRDMIRQVYQDVVDGQEVTDLIKFYNWTDNEYWYCYPTANGLELYRSKSKPHVYQYTINLWGIRRIGEPEYSMGVIGNPYSVEATSNAPSGSETDDSTTTEGDNDQGGNTAQGNPEESGENAAGETANDEASAADTASNNGDTTNNTQQNNTKIPSGGTAYTTNAAALDTQVDITTVTNTRTKNNAIIRTQAEQYAEELRPLIGGYNGLLVPTTAFSVAKDITVLSNGMVSNVNELDQYNFLKNPQLQEQLEELDPNRLLEEMRFAPLVSVETYNLWMDIRNYSSEVMTTELIHPNGSTVTELIKQSIDKGTYLGSTLYGYIKQYKSKYYLSKVDIKYIDTIIIEGMMVYLQLYKIANSTGKIVTPLTLANVNVFIQNLQALAIYLEFNANDTTLFYIQNIMYELRLLEAIMHKVKSDIVIYL